MPVMDCFLFFSFLFLFFYFIRNVKRLKRSRAQEESARTKFRKYRKKHALQQPHPTILQQPLQQFLLTLKYQKYCKKQHPPIFSINSSNNVRITFVRREKNKREKLREKNIREIKTNLLFLCFLS
jgi:signal recognition particle subunit SEC65